MRGRDSDWQARQLRQMLTANSTVRDDPQLRNVAFGRQDVVRLGVAPVTPTRAA